MNSSVGTNERKWQILYRDAVLELDIGALPRKVEAAKAAIHSRMAELEGLQAGTEASQLQDAVHLLDFVLRMYRTKE